MLDTPGDKLLFCFGALRGYSCWTQRTPWDAGNQTRVGSTVCKVGILSIVLSLWRCLFLPPTSQLCPGTPGWQVRPRGAPTKRGQSKAWSPQLPDIGHRLSLPKVRAPEEADILHGRQRQCLYQHGTVALCGSWHLSHQGDPQDQHDHRRLSGLVGPGHTLPPCPDWCPAGSIAGPTCSHKVGGRGKWTDGTPEQQEDA